MCAVRSGALSRHRPDRAVHAAFVASTTACTRSVARCAERSERRCAGVYTEDDLPHRKSRSVQVVVPQRGATHAARGKSRRSGEAACASSAGVAMVMARRQREARDRQNAGGWVRRSSRSPMRESHWRRRPGVHDDAPEICARMEGGDRKAPNRVSARARTRSSGVNGSLPPQIEPRGAAAVRRTSAGCAEGRRMQQGDPGRHRVHGTGRRTARVRVLSRR